MTTRKFFSILIKVLLTVVIIYFLFRQVAHHWQDIKDYDWNLNWGYLVASVFVGLFAFVIMASNWQRIIAGFGFNISLAKCFRIFYLSDMGRYIPGKIWPLMGILYLTKKEGVPPEQATASFVLVQMFAIPASMLVFVLAVQFEPMIVVEQVAMLGSYSTYMITGAMLLVCLILVILPQRVLALGNWLLRKFSRPEVKFVLDKKVALRIFAGYFVGWLCYGGAYYLFLRSVTSRADFTLIAAAGIFNAAYQIGYLMLFAPGGFGPRELAMEFMLTPFLGPIAAAVAILARLWAVVIEVTAAIIALVIKK